MKILLARLKILSANEIQDSKQDFKRFPPRRETSISRSLELYGSGMIEREKERIVESGRQGEKEEAQGGVVERSVARASGISSGVGTPTTRAVTSRDASAAASARLLLVRRAAVRVPSGSTWFRYSAGHRSEGIRCIPDRVSQRRFRGREKSLEIDGQMRWRETLISFRVSLLLWNIAGGFQCRPEEHESSVANDQAGR